jgi:hypothetical protein
MAHCGIGLAKNLKTFFVMSSGGIIAGGGITAGILAGLRPKKTPPLLFFPKSFPSPLGDVQARQISFVIRFSTTGIRGICLPNLSLTGACDLKCHRVRFSLLAHFCRCAST